MITLAAAIVIAAQSPAASLTEDFGVSRVDLLVKAMAAKTGWNIAPTPSVQNDFVYANVKNMTKEEAKKALASLVGGRWVARGSVEELDAPGNSESLMEVLGRKSIEAYFKKETAAVTPFTSREAKELVAAADKMMQKQEDGTYDWREQERLRGQAPITHALKSLAIALGKDFWTGLKIGQRVVFSQNPTRMQRPLPQAAFPILSQMAQDCRLFATAVSQYSQEKTDYTWNPVTQTYRYLPEKFGAMDIIASCREGNSSLEIRIAASDQPGYVVNEQISLSSALSDDMNSNVEKARKLPFVDDKELVPLSESYRKTVEALASQNRGQAMPVSPEILRALVHPEERDVLDVIFREPLDLLTAKIGKGFMASVHDYSIFLSSSAKMTYGDLALGLSSSFFSGASSDLADLGDNKVMIPVDLSISRGVRFSRKAMAALIKGLQGTAPLVDVMSDYCLGYPDMLTDQCAQLLLRGSAMRSFTPVQEDGKGLLRIYGRLPASLKKQAAQGGAVISAGALDPASQQDLITLVYAANVKIAKPDEKPDQVWKSDIEDGAFADPFKDIRERSYSSAADKEPTRIFGGGIPREAALSIKVETQPVWFGEDSLSRWNQGPRAVSMENVASAMVMKEKGMGENYYGAADTFSMGASTGLSMSLAFPGGASASHGVVLDEPGSSQKYKIDTLPADARKTLENALVKMRERYKDAVFNPGNQRKPPQAW